MKVCWGQIYFWRRTAQAWLWPFSEMQTCAWCRGALLFTLCLTVWKKKANIRAAQERWSQININDCSCLQSALCKRWCKLTSSAGPAIMETCSLCLIWGFIEDVSCLWREGLHHREEVPDFRGTHWALQCCTLPGVISHKASLILHQEQLRGLCSEIKRCTIHFLCITGPIIHLNCSERLSKAKCQARCWLRTCRHVHVEGGQGRALQREVECEHLCWQPQGWV